MKIAAEWRGGMRFESNTPSHHTCTIDSGAEGSVTSGPSPMEMVLQALACCTGMDIVSILKKKRQEPEKFSIQVEAERAEDPPRVFTKIHIVYHIKKEALTNTAVEQAIQLSVDKYCSVLNMIKSTAQISWEYKLETADKHR